MSHELPTISIVIPTLNCARLLEDCLRTIRAQDYPPERVEIVVADGGSEDDTIGVARRHGATVVANRLRTAEAGKAAGLRAARHEIVALIDSDNLLEGADWLTRMVAPFADPDVVASEPIRFTVREGDGAMTRYCALLGVNDPLVYYMGNYDRESAASGRWTDLRLPTSARDGWMKVELRGPSFPTIGANGFLARRAFLANAQGRDYLFDIDVIAEAALSAPVHIAKVDVGIVHLYAKDLRSFARKQRRRIVDYYYYESRGMRSFPWRSSARMGRLKFLLACALVFPLVWTAARGALRRPDRAWWLHLPCCYVTLAVYAAQTLRRRLGTIVAEEARRPTF